MSEIIVAGASDLVYGHAQSQADSDDHLIQLWLFDKAPNTQRNYGRQVAELRQSLPYGLRMARLGDLQAYLMGLIQRGLEIGSVAQATKAIKSLWSFGHQVGYFPANVGKVLKPPKPKDTLAERILTEQQVDRILRLELNLRRRLFIAVLYFGGLRVSELCVLRWRDCRSDGARGRLTIYGKGDKTRAVTVPAEVWSAVQRLSLIQQPDEYVFHGSKGVTRRLSPKTGWNWVKKAGERAGLPEVSPHWFRHSHATHSLDRGAPLATVRDTLGHSSVAVTDRYLHAVSGESSGDWLGV